MTYFFIHTPKTSGTTFVDVLSRDPRNTIGYFYPPRREMIKFEERILATPAYHLTNNPDWKKFNFIVGHFAFGIHETLGAEHFKYLGVIREPVSHYLSLYKAFLRMPQDYQQSILPQGISLQNLLAVSFTHNIQTFFLTGMTFSEIQADKDYAFEKAKENYQKYFCGVYPTTRFDEGLFYFKKRIGLKPIPYSRKNQAPSHQHIEIDEELISAIAKINDVDIKLYEYFSALFEQELQKFPLIRLQAKAFQINTWIQTVAKFQPQ